MKAHRLAIAWGLICNLALVFINLNQDWWIFLWMGAVFLLYELVK